MEFDSRADIHKRNTVLHTFNNKQFLERKLNVGS